MGGSVGLSRVLVIAIFSTSLKDVAMIPSSCEVTRVRFQQHAGASSVDQEQARMLTCKPSRARSVIRVAPGDAGPAVMSPWVSCTDRLSIKAYGPGKSARGWKLDVGEGLSPVVPCRSIREAPKPAKVQHVDQLLCREVYKNRHWSPCAMEPRHPTVAVRRSPLRGSQHYRRSLRAGKCLCRLRKRARR